MDQGDRWLPNHRPERPGTALAILLIGAALVLMGAYWSG
jgi:hypothetical protein